jgi:hypothetical protein
MPSRASWSSSQPSTGSQQVVARRHRSANVPTRSSVYSCSRVRGEHRPGLLDMPRLLLTLLSEPVWVMACIPCPIRFIWVGAGSHGSAGHHLPLLGPLPGGTDRDLTQAAMLLGCPATAGPWPASTPWALGAQSPSPRTMSPTGSRL